MRVRLLGAVAVALLPLLGACRSPSPPNVVVVLVDTLRPDYLGCYGHPGGLTPFIDGLAGRGVLYANAYAPSTWTLPSVASLFTSRWPSQHGVVKLFSALPSTERTLAQILRERGFATAGFLATRTLPPASGFGQGFEVWQKAGDSGRLKDGGREVNARTFAWLDGRPRDDRRPVFLYLHYMEPHFPYDPLPDRLEAALAPYGFTSEQRAEWERRLGTFLTHALEEGSGRPDDMGVVRDFYLAEVASFDVVMRELIEGLTARGVLPHGVVVLTADHGEEFYEHGNVGHGLNLFNETLRVPLLLHVPGRTPGVVEGTVSLLDIAPTVLDLVGGPAEPRFEGVSLVRPASGGSAYAELPSTPAGKEPVQDLAVVHGTRKLATTPAGREEFYDLARDPGEREPNGLDATARTALRQTLDVFRGQAGRDVSGARERDVDQTTQERLRALGYVR